MNIAAIIYALAIMGVLGMAFGGMLSVADKKFAVEVDTRVEAIRSVLPGANCGACGHVGCDAFAEAVVAGTAPANGCLAGGASTSAAIGDILGVSVAPSAQKVARVLCQGTTSVARDRYEYDGYRSCRVAASLSGGPKQCRFACIGLGDCLAVCKFGAIQLKDGIVQIDKRRCVGCGACAEVCPHNVIHMLPPEAKVIVRCRNEDVARTARDVCMRACIACGRCVKECKYDAIKIENGFARIDPEKCTLCTECIPVCPCKCITRAGLAQAQMPTQAATV